MSKNNADYLVAIVGAGFSGLGMAIKLKEAGITDFVIVEQANEVGGTWRDSNYPGAAVDVPTHLYSYSFEQNPNWRRMFAKCEEIQEYILDVTKKHNLRPYIQFNTRVTASEYNEDKGYWEVTTDTLGKVTANIVVSAAGPFAKEKIPDLPGLESFKGETVHTAKWNPKINLSGKRVAVVGSGASAIQVVPAIAAQVKKLNVFQRTPPWVVPKADYEFSDLEKSIYRIFPFLQQVRRGIIYGLTELLATAIVWDTPVTSYMEEVSKRHMRKAISDPELLRKVTPNYRLGEIRMLISNDWYPALARENVELIDHKVDKLSEKGVVADNKEYEVDVIIWATGYQSPAQGFPMDVIGREGKNLKKIWSEGIEGFKGVAVAGFPNLFALMGPNTGPGHTSVLVYVEAQQNYIMQAIKKYLKEDIKSYEVKQQVQNNYNKFIDQQLKKTTWGKGGDSWYYNKDGKNTTLYPGFATEYVLSVKDFNEQDYHIQHS